MSSPYAKLGMQSAWRRFALGPIANSPSKFEQQLRDIEAGAGTLNLSSDSVHLAAEIAAFEPDLNDEQRISIILLIVISLAALEEGSTRFPVTSPQSVEPLRRLLSPLCGESFGADGIERMRTAIERILSSSSAAGVIGANPNDYKPLIYLPPFIYQHRILSAEVALARRLATLISARAARIDESRIRDLLLKLTTHFAISGGGRVDLSEEQRAAIECAVTAPLTIISGGPGTGKTSIVLAILKVLVGVGVDPKEIALAAPTGKAAYRIGESIRESLPSDPDDSAAWKGCPVPTTVHRLLGYSPTRRRFRYHRNNPLGAQVVVVDEGSMLDLELMSRLLDALRTDARLVILGDADQLPSVSAGAVFRDLLPPHGEANSALTRNCVRLTRNYRMDSERAGGDAIFVLASAINAGELDLFAPGGGDDDATLTRRDSAQQIEFVGVEWLDEEAASGAFLERWYAEQVRGDGGTGDLENRIFTAIESGFVPTECESLRRVFENVGRSRILCVTRVLDSGSERINSLLHRRVAHEMGMSSDRDQFIVGEPVMMLRNDYERALFNGDQGVVLRVRQPGHEAARMAVFPRGDNFVAFRVDALKEHLELCYAMTVHKAQGSEFDSVAVIMPDKHIPILTREILYTAVSRARRSVTIIGSKDVIHAGISRRIERYSGVREQLARCLNESRRA
jgi:exodeoxyribonuclease V alpha subunit